MNAPCPNCHGLLSLATTIPGEMLSCPLCRGTFTVEVARNPHGGVGGTPFNNPTLRDWFLPEERCYPVFPMGVVTLGSGPFVEGEFDGFLQSRGIQICFPGEVVDTLVLGRLYWDRGELSDHIEGLRGMTLRVYSQEMFLAYLSSNVDPYANRELLAVYRDGHAALEFLLTWGFDWPTTDVVPGISVGTRSGSEAWPAIGLLKYMGYSVGSDGECVTQRREVLRQVFTQPVPNVENPNYMAEWGTPGSMQRLQKLANAIASFARTQKKKRIPPEEAIRDWEADLAWLKETYYQTGFLFSWPCVQVRS